MMSKDFASEPARGRDPFRRVAPGSALFKLAALLFAALLGAAEARAQISPPTEDWRTLRTDHFRVTFPAHLEELGRRAASRARARAGKSIAASMPMIAMTTNSSIRVNPLPFFIAGTPFGNLVFPGLNQHPT